MNLSKYTVDALKYKADIASDEVSSAEASGDSGGITEFLKTHKQCESAAEAGTVEALKELPLAIDELENYTDSDLEPSEWRAITKDLCRVGYFEVFDPKVFWSRRPRTMVVDGVKYVIG